MHSIVTNASWSSGRPVSSRIGDLALDHEHTCVLTHGAGVDPHECDCYVSRLRLVKTPVGRFIPTTEPDLRTNVKFWHNQYEQVRRSNKVLAACLLVSGACGITTAIGLAFELGIL